MATDAGAGGEGNYDQSSDSNEEGDYGNGAGAANGARAHALGGLSSLIQAAVPPGGASQGELYDASRAAESGERRCICVQWQQLSCHATARCRLCRQQQQLCFR